MTMTTRLYQAVNQFEVSVDTDCPQLSGDSSMTLIRIQDIGGITFHESEIDHSGYPKTIDIRAYGNEEARQLAGALIWAGDELRRQIEKNPAPEPEPRGPCRFNRAALSRHQQQKVEN